MRHITSIRCGDMNKPRHDDRPRQKLAQSAEVLQKHNEAVVESAEQLEGETFKQTDAAKCRTQLAANRTILAAERTYAAYARTGLAALASGVGAQALLEDVVNCG